MLSSLSEGVISCPCDPSRTIPNGSAVDIAWLIPLVGAVVAAGIAALRLASWMGRLDEACDQLREDIAELRGENRELRITAGQFAGRSLGALPSPVSALGPGDVQPPKSLGPAPDLDNIRSAVELLREGKLREAEEALRGLYEKHPQESEVVIALAQCLVRFEVRHRELYEIIGKFEMVQPLPPILKRIKVVTTESLKGVREALDVAWQHVQQEPSEPGHYLTLGGYLHATGEVGQAAEVSKKGLQIAEQAKASGRNQDIGEILIKLKGNLAYYWADIGLSELEELARGYAEESHRVLPAPRSLDTLGYVFIVYGKTREEVEKGLALCKDAYRAGTPRRFYDKALAKAASRLAEF